MHNIVIRHCPFSGDQNEANFFGFLFIFNTSEAAQLMAECFVSSISFLLLKEILFPCLYIIVVKVALLALLKSTF